MLRPSGPQPQHEPDEPPPIACSPGQGCLTAAGPLEEPLSSALLLQPATPARTCACPLLAPIPAVLAREASGADDRARVLCLRRF